MARYLMQQKQNRKMFFLDPPGAGKNKGAKANETNTEVYSVEAQALSVLGFLKEQKLTNVILVGQGLGAVVAMIVNEKIKVRVTKSKDMTQVRIIVSLGELGNGHDLRSVLKSFGADRVDGSYLLSYFENAMRSCLSTH